MSAKAATTVFVAALTSLWALPACDEQAQGNTGAMRATTNTQAGAERTTDEPVSAQERGIVARAGGAEVRIGDGVVARAGDSEARTGDGAVGRAESGEARMNHRKKTKDVEGGNRSQGITLEIGGDPGTKFSGRCSVGGEEKVIGGRVPARYVYEPGGDKLECEIRKGGAGTPEVVLTAGNNVRSVQRTSAQGSTINFTYSSSSILSTLGSSN